MNSPTFDTRAIQVGDLVVVVRPRSCCAEYTVMGGVYTVAKFSHLHKLQCPWCHKIRNVTSVSFTDIPNLFTELSRLKRIPPLDELESTKTDESIQEPA